MNADLRKINWDEMLTQFKELNNGDKDIANLVNLVRQTILTACISNSDTKKPFFANSVSTEKRQIIRKKKLKARYLALKAKEPSS